MSTDKRTLRQILARAAKAMPRASRQLFREFLADVAGDEPRTRKVHSWKRKKKPAAKKSRPKQFAKYAKKSRPRDLFDETPTTAAGAEDPGATPAGEE